MTSKDFYIIKKLEAKVHVRSNTQTFQLIDLKVRQSDANNCINPGNNLEQFGGGGMMGDPGHTEFDH